MVVTINFQTEQDLQWLNKIVEMLKQSAIPFEVHGVAKTKPDFQQRRKAFLNTVRSSEVIKTKIEIPGREERNAR